MDTDGTMEKQIVSEFKHIINTGDLYEFQELAQSYLESEDAIAWDYVFQKVYLHAALKKREDITKFMDTLFPRLGPIEQIHIRQMFSYARHLLKK
jgi:hypothetical protein